MRAFRVACLLLVASCGPYVYTGTTRTTTSVPRAPTTSEELVTAMARRHRTGWFRSSAIVFRATTYRIDGTRLREETWWETWAPGRLRIDVGEPSRGTGTLFRADSSYAFQSGRITARRVAQDQILQLQHDIYAQDPAYTIRQLRFEGINLTLFRQDTLDGRRVYVVGAAKGDQATKQMWVDAERLLLLRYLDTQTLGTTRIVRDLRLDGYTPHGGGWVAVEVRIIANGIMTFQQAASEIRVNVSLDEDLFVPERWSAATHWRQQQ